MFHILRHDKDKTSVSTRLFTYAQAMDAIDELNERCKIAGVERRVSYSIVEYGKIDTAAL